MVISEWFQEFLQRTLDFIPHLVVALIVFIGALYLAAPASRWVRKAGSTRITDPSLVDLLAKLTRWAVILTGIVIALEQVKFNVTGFVAGLGIAGLTIGFALQDITRNFVAGIILMTRKPFKVGDSVEISGYTGTVTSINTRDTLLKTLDGNMVILPNINVFNTAIINHSDLPNVRRTLRVTLGSGEDIRKSVSILLEEVRKVDGVASDPAVSVLAETLEDATITLVVRFWVSQVTHNPLEVHSNVVRAVKEAAEREHIDLARPIPVVKLKGS